VIAWYKDNPAEWQPNYFFLEAIVKSQLKIALAKPWKPLNPGDYSPTAVRPRYGMSSSRPSAAWMPPSSVQGRIYSAS
jgi:hypothetical protein